MPSNELYLAVIPLIHIDSGGTTEQVLTLYPDRNFATEFDPSQADQAILMFQRRANTYLTGGHVTGYECTKEAAKDGLVIVRVTQHVK